MAESVANKSEEDRARLLRARVSWSTHRKGYCVTKITARCYIVVVLIFCNIPPRTVQLGAWSLLLKNLSFHRDSSRSNDLISLIPFRSTLTIITSIRKRVSNSVIKCVSSFFGKWDTQNSIAIRRHSRMTRYVASERHRTRAYANQNSNRISESRHMYITSSHAGLTLRNNAPTFSVTFIFVGRLVGSLASLSLGLGNSAYPSTFYPALLWPTSFSFVSVSRAVFFLSPPLLLSPTIGFSFGAFVPFPVGSRDFRKGLLPTSSNPYGTFTLFGEHRSTHEPLWPRPLFIHYKIYHSLSVSLRVLSFYNSFTRLTNVSLARITTVVIQIEKITVQ